MADLILHPNATPVYSFLSMLQAQPPAEAPHPLKVLDCGGGPLPPLTLFRQHGYEAWGVDCSAEQLERARQFCVQHQVEVNLRLGDMRALPFEDESFDALYEHFSMCHLSKADTAAALSEMRRVLKPRGLAFVGVISTGTWPQSLFGEERAPGEFYGEEGGLQNVLHSMFTDEEAQRLVQGVGDHRPGKACALSARGGRADLPGRMDGAAIRSAGRIHPGCLARGLSAAGGRIPIHSPLLLSAENLVHFTAGPILWRGPGRVCGSAPPAWRSDCARGS